MVNELKVQRQLNKKDLDVLNDLNLEMLRIITRKCMLVKWSMPPSGWIKLNCNGSCQNNPSGGGGILQDMDGNFKAAFSSHFGLGTNNKAELRAILEGIRLCKSLSFSKIIIESDSNLIVDWLRSGKCTLWHLWNYWNELSHELQGTDTRVIHQLREGNQAADFLAKQVESWALEVEQQAAIVLAWAGISTKATSI
ncbi:hypothetical protein F2P56_009026 [Juglans regia]|uniref:RNase H type-1 domain-containing protein n=2 Tax=Juglans regia TaxID=51240 RepID=A0A834D0W4_JUGRE|nr:ribonuclease H-like [Juglans regia]KAF5472295.1 hypothetical protein F2P56_009026 [Juglans regia]